MGGESEAGAQERLRYLARNWYAETEEEQVRDRDKCPVCKGESGIVLGFDVLGEDGLRCAACGVALEVEYDERWDGEDEYCYFWLTEKP